MLSLLLSVSFANNFDEYRIRNNPYPVNSDVRMVSAIDNLKYNKGKYKNTIATSLFVFGSAMLTVAGISRAIALNIREKNENNRLWEWSKINNDSFNNAANTAVVAFSLGLTATVSSFVAFANNSKIKKLKRANRKKLSTEAKLNKANQKHENILLKENVIKQRWEQKNLSYKAKINKKEEAKADKTFNKQLSAQLKVNSKEVRNDKKLLSKQITYQKSIQNRDAKEQKHLEKIEKQEQRELKKELAKKAGNLSVFEIASIKISKRLHRESNKAGRKFLRDFKKGTLEIPNIEAAVK